MNWPLDPTTGKCEPTITQLFGENPGGYARFGYPGHNGLDLWTDHVPAIVYAIEAGTVEKVGWEGDGYGKYVTLYHEGGWRTYYAHLSAVYVLPGEALKASAALGLMGSTGNSSGPHLHLGVRCPAVCNPPYKGYVDPLPLLRGAPLAIHAGGQVERAAFDPSPADRPALPKGTQLFTPGKTRGKKTMFRRVKWF